LREGIRSSLILLLFLLVSFGTFFNGWKVWKGFSDPFKVWKGFSDPFFSSLKKPRHWLLVRFPLGHPSESEVLALELGVSDSWLLGEYWSDWFPSSISKFAKSDKYHKLVFIPSLVQ
jgi:hypothetical protein